MNKKGFVILESIIYLVFVSMVFILFADLLFNIRSNVQSLVNDLEKIIQVTVMVENLVNDLKEAIPDKNLIFNLNEKKFGWYLRSNKLYKFTNYIGQGKCQGKSVSLLACNISLFNLQVKKYQLTKAAEFNINLSLKNKKFLKFNRFIAFRSGRII